MQIIAKAPIGIFMSSDSNLLNPIPWKMIEPKDETGPELILVRHAIRFTHQKFRLVAHSRTCFGLNFLFSVPLLFAWIRFRIIAFSSVVKPGAVIGELGKRK